MSPIEETLAAQAGRSLPILLNGNTKKGLTIFRHVFGDKRHVVAHCHTDFDTVDLYREVLRQSQCTVPPEGALMDIQDVTQALEAAGYEWLVFSGFQMLQEETLKDFAFDLKIAFETSSLQLMMIGSFPDGNPLLRFNGDLWQRVTEIKAD